MIIAIDGPAAAGKGTIARKLASHLRFHYLDTGSLYRAVAVTMLSKGLDPADVQAAARTADNLQPDSIPDALLRSAEAGEAASIVAAIPEVRASLLKFQRDFAQKSPGTVLDGRDIGTVVCPDAPVKIFVTASAAERARRRHKELVEAGSDIDLATVLADIERRDERDSNRSSAPLVAAADAHLLDTSKLDIEGAFQAAIDIVNSHLS